MESYPEVRQYLAEFIGNFIQKVSISQSYLNGIPQIRLEGTAYEEVNAKESIELELTEYESIIELHHDDIKKVDFPSCRSKIYEAIKKRTQELNKNFLKELDKSTPKKMWSRIIRQSMLYWK